MKIDKNKLARFIADSQFGTGTLAKSLDIHPDVLHKVIALAEGEESLVRRIESVLKGSITENGEKFLHPANSWSKESVKDKVGNLTIDETIRFILDNPSTRNLILEIEQDKEHSRSSLLNLIKPRDQKPRDRKESDSENRETEKRVNPKRESVKRKVKSEENE